MRIDRAISVHVVHPWLKLSARIVGRSVPVLMYHSISEDPEPSVHPYFKVNTHPEVFQMHLELLRDKGFKPLALSEVYGVLEQRNPDKHVVITFDDGLLDFYTNAYPLLRRFGYLATVFLPTGYISERPAPNMENHLSLAWTHVREMSNAGVDFGSHSITHPQLALVDHRVMEREIVDSKKMIEDKLCKPVESFAYPLRFPEENKGFVARYREILSKAGYRLGVTTIIGTVSATDDPLTLRRLPLNSCDDSTLLIAKLAGAYNWLHLPQLIAKKIRRLAR